LVFLMSWRTLQYFPGMHYVQELWYVLCFLALVFVYPAWKYLNRLRLTSFEIYVVVLTLVAVLLPAWGAKREFGQPLVYGLLAQRAAVLTAPVLLLFVAMRSHRVQPRDIEWALLSLGWGTLVLYSLMLLFLNPENFLSYGIGFADAGGGKAVFRFPMGFIVFALIYYTLLGFRTRRTRHYVAAAILLIWVVSSADARWFLVSLTATFVYFLYQWRPLGQFVGTIAKGCCVFAVVIGFGYAVSPDYLATRAAGFSDAFRVVFTGSAVADISANIRVFETLTALPYIQKNPLLGNGTISNQWERGQDILGPYFYPGDIGLIGALYSVGVLGLVVFAYQFWFAYGAARKLSRRRHSPLFDAAIGFLLLNAIGSITATEFVYFPETTLLFIAILVALAYEEDCGRRRVIHGEQRASMPGITHGYPTSS